MDFEHEKISNRFMQEFPYVNSICFIEHKDKIAYHSQDWDEYFDIKRFLIDWRGNKKVSHIFSNTKYLVRIITEEKLVASALNRSGHIIGTKKKEHIILAQIEYDGFIQILYTELARILHFWLTGDHQSINWLYQERSIKRNDLNSSNKSLSDFKNEKDETDIPFTARLMAYYRAQESDRQNPLFIDPYAKKLSGHLDDYLNDHIRYSEMDYPLVRSYFIDNHLISQWCQLHKKSQIILMGAGLDTRAYRLDVLKNNSHTVFEIDFQKIMDYKRQKLESISPLCELKYISSDLSTFDWISLLKSKGYSENIPSFWILEGLVYYIEREKVTSLIKQLASLSHQDSQIFVDLLHISRWSNHQTFEDSGLSGPFTKHFRWAIPLSSVTSFFEKLGWDVSTCFADKHDQGRNVGQKVMIFAFGQKKND